MTQKKPIVDAPKPLPNAMCRPLMAAPAAHIAGCGRLLAMAG